MPSAHIRTLDGWRAIAILLVTAHHFGTSFYARDDYWSNAPTRFGTVGVPVFFGLSGFLITALLLAEFEAYKRISLKSFYVRRCFRILPPFFVYLSAVGFLGLIVSRFELLSCLFFFRNYLSEARSGLFTNHIWSLSVEEHFYLIWPITLCVLLRMRKLSLMPVIALAFGIWRSLDYHLHLLHRLAPILDTPMRTDLRLDGLIWGCCAAIVFRDQRLRNIAAGRLRQPIFWALVGLFICSLTMAIPLATVWSAALIPVLILSTVLNPEWGISLFLEMPALRWIGKISYSLYLWQQLFLVPKWEPHPVPWLQSLPFSLLLPFVCATLSYFVVEQPAIRLGRQFAKQIRIGSALSAEATPAIVEAT